MKKIIIQLLIVCFLFISDSLIPQTGSKKSTKSYHGGTYKGGKGSSHKGGKYKNSSTGNHYRKRK